MALPSQGHFVASLPTGSRTQVPTTDPKLTGPESSGWFPGPPCLLVAQV